MLSKSTFFAGLALVLGIAVSTPACAQVWGGRDRDRDDRAWERNDYSRQAYDNGYRRGMDRGERDARSQRVADFRYERDYRDGDWGYNGRYGSRDYYRESFRRGFEAGYRAGYSRYGGYGNEGRAVPRYGYPGAYPDRGPYTSGRYGYGNDIAFRNGYDDGLEKGRKDGRSGKSYNLLRHDWYRDGDRHYKHEYGSRERYRDLYRDGFRQGYDAAYRGGRW